MYGSPVRRLGPTLILLIAAVLVAMGEVRAGSSRPVKQVGRWRFEVGWGGVVDMHDVQGLGRRDGEPGSAVLNIEPSSVFQVAAGWEVVRETVLLRGELDAANLSIDDWLGFYSADPEPTFSGTFRVADTRWSAFRLEVVVSEKSSKDSRFDLFAGMAWNQIGPLEISPQALEGFSLESVTTDDGSSFHLGCEWLGRISRRSGWSVGLSGAWSFGTGAQLHLETDPSSPFESGTISFRPWTITVRASWQPSPGKR